MHPCLATEDGWNLLSTALRCLVLFMNSPRSNHFEIVQSSFVDTSRILSPIRQLLNWMNCINLPDCTRIFRQFQRILPMMATFWSDFTAGWRFSFITFRHFRHGYVWSGITLTWAKAAWNHFIIDGWVNDPKISFFIVRNPDWERPLSSSLRVYLLSVNTSLVRSRRLFHSTQNTLLFDANQTILSYNIATSLISMMSTANKHQAMPSDRQGRTRSHSLPIDLIHASNDNQNAWSQFGGPVSHLLL
jgi:hypothetical protein